MLIVRYSVLQLGIFRYTYGVQLWPEPFFVRDANGEEIVVLLADTQGTFDLQSSTKDNAVIFSFATLISSTLVRYFTHLKELNPVKQSRKPRIDIGPFLTDKNDFEFRPNCLRPCLNEVLLFDVCIYSCSTSTSKFRALI